MKQDAKYSKTITIKTPYDKEVYEGKGYVVKKTPEGYQCELAVPLSELEVKSGESIGMHITLIDMIWKKRSLKNIPTKSAGDAKQRWSGP